MVFPIQWPEPFGLVMVEAMACGTPVVACPAGAAVELVENGVTGFLRDSIDDLVGAVADIGKCSPIDCRRRVEESFSATAMVKGYEQLYESVVARLATIPNRAGAGSPDFHYGGSANRIGGHGEPPRCSRSTTSTSPSTAPRSCAA